MGVVERRKRALCDLLGTENIPLASDFPDSLALPERIHRGSLLAIGRTIKDGKERSTGFKYKYGRWMGGVMLKGTSHDINGRGNYSANVGTRAEILLMLNRPHLWLHTHPRPPRKIIEEALRAAVKSHDWPEEKIAEELDGVVAYDQAVYMLPSKTDIRSNYLRSIGAIGNMISTKESSYLILRKDLGYSGIWGGDWFGGVGEADRSRALAEFDQADTDIFKEILEAHNIKQAVLAATAKALGHRYVSYFSNDPESPRLERVEG